MANRCRGLADSAEEEVGMLDDSIAALLLFSVTDQLTDSEVFVIVSGHQASYGLITSVRVNPLGVF